MKRSSSSAAAQIPRRPPTRWRSRSASNRSGASRASRSVMSRALSQRPTRHVNVKRRVEDGRRERVQFQGEFDVPLRLIVASAVRRAAVRAEVGISALFGSCDSARRKSASAPSQSQSIPREGMTVASPAPRREPTPFRDRGRGSGLDRRMILRRAHVSRHVQQRLAECRITRRIVRRRRRHRPEVLGCQLQVRWRVHARWCQKYRPRMYAASAFRRQLLVPLEGRDRIGNDADRERIGDTRADSL